MRLKEGGTDMEKDMILKVVKAYNKYIQDMERDKPELLDFIQSELSRRELVCPHCGNADTDHQMFDYIDVDKCEFECLQCGIKSIEGSEEEVLEWMEKYREHMGLVECRFNISPKDYSIILFRGTKVVKPKEDIEAVYIKRKSK